LFRPSGTSAERLTEMAMEVAVSSGHGVRMMSDAATVLKSRIRADLTAAMKARDSAETRLLRALLAALDNAEAVSVGTAHDRYQVRMFGDASVEVPRRVLSEGDIRDLLLRETTERDAAAREFERLNQQNEAERLRYEIALIARYATHLLGDRQAEDESKS
jgi:uncharacterized protein YqeY